MLPKDNCTADTHNTFSKQPFNDTKELTLSASLAKSFHGACLTCLSMENLDKELESSLHNTSCESIHKRDEKPVSYQLQKKRPTSSKPICPLHASPATFPREPANGTLCFGQDSVELEARSGKPPALPIEQIRKQSNFPVYCLGSIYSYEGEIIDRRRIKFESGSVYWLASSYYSDFPFRAQREVLPPGGYGVRNPLETCKLNIMYDTDWVRREQLFKIRWQRDVERIFGGRWQVKLPLHKAVCVGDQHREPRNRARGIKVDWTIDLAAPTTEVSEDVDELLFGKCNSSQALQWRQTSNSNNSGTFTGFISGRKVPGIRRPIPCTSQATFFQRQKPNILGRDFLSRYCERLDLSTPSAKEFGALLRIIYKTRYENGPTYVPKARRATATAAVTPANGSHTSSTCNNDVVEELTGDRKIMDESEERVRMNWLDEEESSYFRVASPACRLEWRELYDLRLKRKREEEELDRLKYIRVHIEGGGMKTVTEEYTENLGQDI